MLQMNNVTVFNNIMLFTFHIFAYFLTATLKVAAMVLILGRRINREDSGIRDSPAVKRKV